jgi:hypothetical protein
VAVLASSPPSISPIIEAGAMMVMKMPRSVELSPYRDTYGASGSQTASLRSESLGKRGNERSKNVSHQYQIIKVNYQSYKYRNRVIITIELALGFYLTLNMKNFRGILWKRRRDGRAEWDTAQRQNERPK